MVDLANVPFEVIHEFEREYVFACYLYYHGPTDAESPLTDHEFDCRQGFLEYWWNHASPQFRARTTRGQLKTDAHALVLTDEEKRGAFEWAATK